MRAIIYEMGNSTAINYFFDKKTLYAENDDLVDFFETIVNWEKPFRLSGTRVELDLFHVALEKFSDGFDDYDYYAFSIPETFEEDIVYGFRDNTCKSISLWIESAREVVEYWENVKKEILGE